MSKAAKIRDEVTLDDPNFKEAFDEFLDETFGVVNVAGLEYNTSEVFREVDPVAYRSAFLDWIDSLEDEDILSIAGEEEEEDENE